MAKVMRQKIKVGEWSSSELRQLHEMLSKGFAPQKAAAKLHRSLRSVRIAMAAPPSDAPLHKGKESEDVKLRDLWSADLAAAKIADALGISLRETRIRAAALGLLSLPQKSWSPEETRLLLSMVEQKQSKEEIAAALERSVGSVQGRAFLLRISLDQRPKKIRSRRRLKTRMHLA